MGVSEIYLGKGVVVPVEYFVRKYLGYFKEHYDGGDEWEVIDSLIKEKFGDDGVKWCQVGHDAFEGRGGLMKISLLDKNMKAVEQIMGYVDDGLEWDYDKDSGSDHKRSEDLEEIPVETVGVGGKFLFIGYFEEIESDDGGEFSHYVKAPEIIYSLAALIPSMMEIYPRLLEKKCDKLEEEFKQSMGIWTFTSDCCCCG